MESDRIKDTESRTRLGYISLNVEEEEYIRLTVNKMNQLGVNVGKNMGGKLARISILFLCDCFNMGKFKELKNIKNEATIREAFKSQLK